MPRAFCCLLLFAAHVSVMVDGKPWQNHLQTREQTQTSSDPSLTEPSLKSSKRPGFSVILPVKSHSSNFVSIFDLRRKRFLCMDQKGELFYSRQRDTEDCLFQRLWLDWPNKHDVFYSTKAARLLKLRGLEFNISKRTSSELPAEVRHTLLHQMLKRQKRSQQVNPSDPFRFEAHPLPVEPDQPIRDQTGAVSKETITSCDDPLKVLQPNGPGSPVKSNIGDQADEAKIVLEI